MKIFTPPILIAGIFTLVVGTLSTTAFSEIKPEDEIKFRQSGMTYMRWNMGKIENQVSKNPETYNKEQVAAAANVIAAIANSGIGALFSENSKTGKGWKDTRVKPEFFEQPEEVKKYAGTFRKEANKLAAVTESGDVNVIREQFDTVISACKECHKKFRSKD